jgi:hypothetical protein
MYTDAFNVLERTMPGLTKKVLLPGTGHWVQQGASGRSDRLDAGFPAANKPIND